jgi:hypothetical protein
VSETEVPDDRLAFVLRAAGSRALVVGTGHHVAGSRLPDVPAVDDTVPALRRALVERCGMRHARALVDPADPKEFLGVLRAEAAMAEDVFLFYYVGHGLVSSGNELHLATRATEDEGIGLEVDALRYTPLREALMECPARSIMVVLDCCFSGRAYGGFGTAVADAFEMTPVRNSFLLCSASADEQALAPEGEAYTAFSGALLRFLNEGDRTAGRYLTADDVYRHLYRALPARGMPVPHRRAGDRAGELVLADNPAAPAPERELPRQDTDTRPSVDGPCPYRGLDAFTELDATYFFGRDRLVSETLARLAEQRDGTAVVAVVGRSGAGKSSLLQAGVLPAIRAGGLRVPGARTWPQLTLTPGDHPVHALASRLARPAGASAESIRDELLAEPSRLGEIVRRAVRDRNARDTPDARLVLVVDQFEEVFTACADEGERRAFVEAICAAGRVPDRTTTPPLLTVLGVRADFYGHCLDYPELAAAVAAGQVPVRPMTGTDLHAVIERPAEAAGLTLERGLADRLVADLRSGLTDTDDSGGTLPLLSYALLATWQRREGATLTLFGYQATGGIWNAITQQAERTYDALGEDMRRAARQSLSRMVRLGDGTEDTRRRVARGSTSPVARRWCGRCRGCVPGRRRDGRRRRNVECRDRLASILKSTLKRAVKNIGRGAPSGTLPPTWLPTVRTRNPGHFLVRRRAPRSCARRSPRQSPPRREALVIPGSR